MTELVTPTARVGVERKPIVRDGSCTNSLHHGSQPLDRILPHAEKVKVMSRAVGHLSPQLKEHRTLQNKSAAVVRDAQAIQESFDDVPGKDELKLLVVFLGKVCQPGADRCG
jgi:hypothetical protein